MPGFGARMEEPSRVGAIDDPPEATAPGPRLEPVVVAALLVAMLLLRIVYALHYRADSDEPQHLHVAWAWTQGLVQYRDVFDNHAPLFHLLCAPLVRAFGERPDILIAMRFAMFPLYLGSLAAVYAIAAAFYSRRIAMWATVFAAAAPGFFLNSVEFRADDLWGALWLLAIAVLVRGRLTRKRGFVVGLLLGATLAVSMKTTLLLAGLGIGAVAGLAVSDTGWRGCTSSIVAGLCGFPVVPMGLVALFAWHGALGPMLIGTITHNALPGLGLWHKAPWRIVLLPAAVVPLWLAVSLVARAAPTSALAVRRVLVLVATSVFLVLLVGAWPLVTREDFIPVVPLVALLVAPLLVALPLLRTSLAVPLVVVAVEVACAFGAGLPWTDHMKWQTALVASVMQITGPDDYVMDLKGETTFRRRPYFYVLEYITKERLVRGLLSDSIPEDLVATRTAVVLEDQPGFPPRGRRFMAENYLPVGLERLRVLGRLLPEAEANGSAIAFEVVVPARYAIVAEHGTVRGSLDGSAYEGPRFLAPGRHELRTDPADTVRLAVLWARAAEQGLTPFHLQEAAS